SFNINIKWLDDKPVLALSDKFFTRPTQGYPSIIQTSSLKIINKRKIAARKKVVRTRLVFCTSRHLDGRLKRLHTTLEYRPFARPIDRQDKCFATGIYSSLFIRANGKEYAIPVAVRCFHQIRMTGPLYRVWSALIQMPLR